MVKTFEHLCLSKYHVDIRSVGDHLSVHYFNRYSLLSNNMLTEDHLAESPLSDYL